MAKKRTPRPDIRTLVYDMIRTYPGIHLREVERQVGISATLAHYHLKSLAEEGYVDVHEQGGYTRYYPTSKGKAASVLPADLPILGLLREETPLHIVLILLDEGPCPHGEIHERIEGAKSTLSYHLHKLAEAGIVEREPGSHRIRLRERERIYRIMLAYRPTPGLRDSFADLWEGLYG